MRKSKELYYHFSDFLSTVTTNALPDYTFIEPRYVTWTKEGVPQIPNDQHPPHSVARGEQLIADVYNALYQNPELSDTSDVCLLITYDEHGGFYDTQAPKWHPENRRHPSNEHNRVRQRLGVRVPAVLISPRLLDHKKVSVQMDHASIPVTISMCLTGSVDWLPTFSKCATNFVEACTWNVNAAKMPALPAVKEEQITSWSKDNYVIGPSWLQSMFINVKGIHTGIRAMENADIEIQVMVDFFKTEFTTQ